MMKQIFLNNSIKTLLLIGSALLFVACGGGGGSSSDDQTSSTSTTARGSAVATMPAANFSSVGEQSAISETVSSDAEGAVEAEGPDLALGERIYGNHCAECHGAKAEGDSAAALTGLALDKAEFENLLRTGGEIGSEHLFGTQKVSEKGLGGLFAYLSSLE